LERELAGLTDARLQRMEGGVELAAEEAGLWHICRGSALAEGVARTFEQLEGRVARLPLHAFLARGGPLPRIRVVCRRSRLYHSDAVAARVEGVLRRRLSCSEAPPTQLLHVRLEHDQLQLSVDAAGEPLHRRGYRKHIGAAPLRETLAAAVVQAADYRGGPLWDPFCGSGTLVIEALRRSSGVLPGAGRSFAFQGWPTHESAAYTAFCEDAGAAPAQADVSPLTGVIGSDRDQRVLGAAQDNAARAGVEGVQWIHGSFEEVVDAVPEGATLIANPPYGRRLHDPHLSRTYVQLGEVLRRRRDLGRVLLLDGSGGLLLKTRLSWRALWSFQNRGLPVRIVELSREGVES